jgi:calcineurin-like phosphoesterase
MRILFLGDIVGKPGVSFVKRALPVMVPREGIDLVIANAENATDGSGLSPKDYRRLREAGVGLVTLGDHVYKKRDIIPTLQEDEHICRPANFPPGAPGREFAIGTARDGTSVAAFALLGRTYMRPAGRCAHPPEASE